MLKKKAKSPVKHESKSKPTEDCPVEEKQHEASPYSSPAFTLLFGPSRRAYTVHQKFLSKSAILTTKCGLFRLGRTFELPEIAEDTGHTLVHYLYTDTYQALRSADISDEIKGATEYKRNVAVYYAAREYGLDGLEQLAAGNIESFDGEIPILTLLAIVADTYERLVGDQTWYTDRLTRRIRAAFEADRTIFASQAFLDLFGRVESFNKFLMKAVVETYTDKIANITPGPYYGSLYGLRTASSNHHNAVSDSISDAPHEAVCDTPCETICDNPCEVVSDASLDAACEPIPEPAYYDEPPVTIPPEPEACEPTPCMETPVPAMEDEIYLIEGEPLSLECTKCGRKRCKKHKEKNRIVDTFQYEKPACLPEPKFDVVPEFELNDDANCKFRSSHLMKEKKWKNCLNCQNFLRHVSRQLELGVAVLEPTPEPAPEPVPEGFEAVARWGTLPKF